MTYYLPELHNSCYLFIGFSYFHPTGNDTVNTGKSALALRAQCIYMYVLHKPWVNVFSFPQNVKIY